MFPYGVKKYLNPPIWIIKRRIRLKIFGETIAKVGDGRISGKSWGDSIGSGYSHYVSESTMHQKQSNNKEKSHDGNTGQNNHSWKDNSGTYSTFIGVGATSFYALFHAIPYIDSSISLSQYAKDYIYGKVDDSKSTLPEENLKTIKSNADLMREKLEEDQIISEMIQEAEKRKADKRTNNKSDYVCEAVKKAQAVGRKEAQDIIAENKAMADKIIKKKIE